jgi:hypothetical protein
MNAVQQSIAAGARNYKACAHIGLSVRTYQRWGNDGDKIREDARKTRVFVPVNKLPPTLSGYVLKFRYLIFV